MMTTNKYSAASYDAFLSAYYNMVAKPTLPQKKFREIVLVQVNPKPDEDIIEFSLGTNKYISLNKL